MNLAEPLLCWATVITAMLVFVLVIARTTVVERTAGRCGAQPVVPPRSSRVRTLDRSVTVLLAVLLVLLVCRVIAGL